MAALATTGVIEVRAGGLRFVPSQLTVAAGKTVTLRLKNVDVMEHDLVAPYLTIRRQGAR